MLNLIQKPGSAVVVTGVGGDSHFFIVGTPIVRATWSSVAREAERLSVQAANGACVQDSLGSRG